MVRKNGRRMCTRAGRREEGKRCSDSCLCQEGRIATHYIINIVVESFVWGKGEGGRGVNFSADCRSCL